LRKESRKNKEVSGLQRQPREDNGEGWRQGREQARKAAGYHYPTSTVTGGQVTPLLPA
jgi:hypothetical protein